MIRSYFGTEKNPFSLSDIQLLQHQQEIYDILDVHSQQGGLCLLLGEPGTGKTAGHSASLRCSPMQPGEVNNSLVLFK